MLTSRISLCASVLALATLAGFALQGAPRADAVASAPAQYKIDPVHSSLVFKVRHMGITDIYGRFNEFSGGLAFDPENLGESQIAFTAEAKSIDTANGKRDEHLRGPDFFNSVQFPRITFATTSITKGGAEDEYDLKGEFELLGKQLPIEVEVEMNGAAEGRDGSKLIGFTAEFTIKRSLFGMDYGIGNLGDEVDVVLSIQAAQG